MLDSSHKRIAPGVVLKVEKGLHAFGVDEAAEARVALWQIAFSGWVTLSARKWVISRERRGPPRAVNIPYAVAKALPGEVYPGEIVRDEEGKKIASTTTVFPV